MTTALQPIQGLHHVTAITNNARKNIDFYTGQLGLRLVKVTINYDDPSTYHLYYGDGVGTPGTIMTFFAWAGRRGTLGTGMTAETAFAIPQGSLAFWQNRFAGKSELTQRFGQSALLIRDADEMPLALIETPVTTPERAWSKGAIPVEHAIRGFHSVTLNETDATLPAAVLVDRFGYRETDREGSRIRYQSATGTLANIVDVLTQPRVQAHGGTGTVHHIAFRVPDDATQVEWLKTLRGDGHHVSPVMDRDYFHSIYFREPGGILFELATDGPGFAINEPVETLGTKLILPAWLEPQRAAVEAGLQPLKEVQTAVATV